MPRQLALLLIAVVPVACNPASSSNATAPPTMVERSRTAWEYEPSWAATLTPADVGSYQILLPTSLKPVEVNIMIPANMKKYVWTNDRSEPHATLAISIIDDKKLAEEGRKSMQKTMVNFLGGVTESLGMPNSTRGLPDFGKLDGLEFTRFTWNGIAPKTPPGIVHGLIYGAQEKNITIMIVVTAFGDKSESIPKGFEPIIATFRKKK